VIDIAGQELFLHGVTGGPEAVGAYLHLNSPFKHSTFFVRTDALVRHGNYDKRFNVAEDYELLLRIARRGKVDCLPDTLIDYVDDPSGISTSRRPGQLRARLRAQFMHVDPLSASWHFGVARTLGLIVTPHGWAKRLSIAHWNRQLNTSTPTEA